MKDEPRTDGGCSDEATCHVVVLRAIVTLTLRRTIWEARKEGEHRRREELGCCNEREQCEVQAFYMLWQYKITCFAWGVKLIPGNYKVGTQL